MRRWLGVVFLTSVSCDQVLGLTQHFDAAEPAIVDADLRPDAIDCVNYPGGQPDEDADGRNDFCDNCPTVANVTQIDGDGDLVGADCDPAPLNAGDHIAFFGSMLTMDGLELDPGVTLANGAATIANSRLTITNPIKPVKVIAEISLRSFNATEKTTMEVVDGSGNEWSCNVGFALGECAGDNCLYTKVPGAAPQPATFDEVALTTRVMMVNNSGNGFTQCTATTPGAMATNPAQSNPTSLEPQGTVAVKSTGTVEVRNVIVYDRP